MTYPADRAIHVLNDLWTGGSISSCCLLCFVLFFQRLQVGPTNGFQRNDEWWTDVFREKAGRRAQKAASCMIYKFKEDRRQIVVARNIAYKASDENVVVRGEGGGFGKLCVPLEKSWLRP